jgi:hypothetical protein
VADALSRVGYTFSIQSTFAVVPVWIREVLNSYTMDDAAHQLLQELAVVSLNDKGFSLSQGLIRHKKRIWVGANSTLHTNIIHLLWEAIQVIMPHFRG